MAEHWVGGLAELRAATRDLQMAGNLAAYLDLMWAAKKARNLAVR
jgi:hypothetical protein